MTLVKKQLEDFDPRSGFKSTLVVFGVIIFFVSLAFFIAWILSN